MKKLPAVESAKQLMTEAMKWSVMTWMREKKRVRKSADEANAALDELEQKVKSAWPESARKAYESLDRTIKHELMKREGAVAKCKTADEEADGARASAEETFDRAEKVLSTALAREGCNKAIRSWELKEKAILLAEEVERSIKG